MQMAAQELQARRLLQIHRLQQTVLPLRQLVRIVVMDLQQ